MQAKSSVVNQEFLEALAEHLTHIDNSHVCINLLTGLFSAREIRMISNRYLIAVLISEGWDHRTIAHMLDVGIATVSRISAQYQLGRFEYVI